MRYNLLRLRSEAVANQQPLQRDPFSLCFSSMHATLAPAHLLPVVPSAVTILPAVLRMYETRSTRHPFHRTTLRHPSPHHPAHPIYPVHPVFTRSSRSTRSTRSTSVLLTENCLLPANNGSTGITRGSPLFIMLDDLVRRLRGLKIRNRLKHFSLRRNSLLSSLPFVPFVLYAAFVSKNGWREGNRWSISTNEIRWKFNIDRKEFFLYEGIHFLLPFFFLFCIRFFVGRRKEIIIHTAMKIQNWLKNFFYFHSLSYFFSVSLDEERKSRTNHSMICLSSFVIE